MSFLILFALAVTLWDESSAATYEKKLLITPFTGLEFRLSSMNMHHVLRCHFFTPIKNLDICFYVWHFVTWMGKC